MRQCDYEQVDKAQRKEKALQSAKTLNFPTFKASDGWLDKWKKR